MNLTEEQRLDRAMSEKELQSEVVKLARAAGWIVYHPYRPGTTTESGFPDLVMARTLRSGGGRFGVGLLVVECKRETEELGIKQLAWASVLVTMPEPVAYRVWRPSDLRRGVVQEMLR